MSIPRSRAKFKPKKAKENIKKEIKKEVKKENKNERVKNLDNADNPDAVRIQKYISQTGYCSRRKAEELIEQGKVKVNGKVAVIGQKVLYTDNITINNKPISVIEGKDYYLINKPLGYVCTKDEQFGRPIVFDLIKEKKHLLNAGRLDMYTTGALILTNDGELINTLTHPKHNVKKEYYVTVRGKITEKQLDMQRTGVVIDGYKTRPAIVKFLGYNEKNDVSRYSITISEGKNRQVRKMAKEAKMSVVALHRHRIGHLDVRKLKPGEYIKLSKEDVKKLI